MSSSLRLAFFADPTETHTQRWVRFFEKRGHQVSVIVRHDMPGPPPGAGGPRVIRVAPPRTVRWPGRWFDLLHRIRIAVREADPQVVHAHYLTAQGWLAWASGFRPYAVTVWGSDIYLDLQGQKSRLLGRLALRGADLVTADSVNLARAAVRAGARGSRTAVVQFGVDTEAFKPLDATSLRSRLAPGGGRIVLSPRTMLPLYRHELVVAALSDLPDDVIAVFTARGASADVIRSVRREAQHRGLSDRIVIEPEIPHDEMPRYLNAADVVVSLPASDATPVTLLEAMACGRPTVLADLPSLREWYAGGRPDLVVHRPNPSAVATAVRRALILSDADRRDLLTRGRTLVSERADHERNMLMVEERYRRMVRRE